MDYYLAMVSMYLTPDVFLLQESLGTLWVCKYLGNTALRVVDVKCIESVVAMVPWDDEDNENEEDRQYKEGDEFFMVEKLGSEMASMAGVDKEADEED